MTTCAMCDGLGYDRQTAQRIALRCGLSVDRVIAFKPTAMHVKCDSCKGTGSIPDRCGDDWLLGSDVT